MGGCAGPQKRVSTAVPVHHTPGCGAEPRTLLWMLPPGQAASASHRVPGARVGLVLALPGEMKTVCLELSRLPPRKHPDAASILPIPHPSAASLLRAPGQSRVLVLNTDPDILQRMGGGWPVRDRLFKRLARLKRATARSPWPGASRPPEGPRPGTRKSGPSRGRSCGGRPRTPPGFRFGDPSALAARDLALVGHTFPGGRVKLPLVNREHELLLRATGDLTSASRGSLLQFSPAVPWGSRRAFASAVSAAAAPRFL